jgi:exonuclease VII small subunit
MKKFLCILLTVIFVLPAFVLAEENEIEECDAISIEEAMQMALDDMIAMRTMNNAIRDMEVQHRDLSHQLYRLERGGIRRDALRQLNDAVHRLDNGIAQLQSAQALVGGQIEQTFQDAFAVMAAGAEDEANLLLQATIAGMTTTSGMTSQISQLEAQRTMLFTEINNLNDADAFRDAINSLKRGLHELNRQLNNLREQQTIIELSMENGLRSLLAILSDIDRGIATLEANMELADVNLRRMTIGFSVGIISAHDLRSIEHGISQGYVQLENLRHNRATVAQGLNSLLGLPFDSDVIVAFEPGEIPETPENLNQHIRRQIEQAPSIRQLQFAVDAALANRRDYTGHDNDIIISAHNRRRALETIRDNESANEEILEIRNRIALQEAVERTIAERDHAMRAMDSAIRQAYRELDALVAQLAARTADLEHAEASLIVANANFAAGRITAFDVSQAELAVATASRAIDGIHNQIWLLAFTLENPVLL